MMHHKLMLLLLLTLLAISVQVQGQQTRSVPIPISNPGFEDGAKGWRLPANATIVSDQAFAGKQSARLTVRDPKKDGVYITRQVPVVGGAYYVVRCRVKTAGVTKNPDNASSVGAGLIVEWADKKGEWYDSGEYATKLYGDNGWTVREVRKSCRAPERAGFAYIYLALRGIGTAWFDDLEVERVDRLLTPEAPSSGQSLRANRPLLCWRDDPQAMNYTAEISRDAAFPTADTIRLETEQSSIRPPKPIEPGRWYWRVSAPGYAPTEPRSFEQTAAVGEDTTPPEIEAQPTRVTSADARVRIRIRHSGVDARRSTVQARLGNQVVPVAIEPVDATAVIAVLSPRWELGLNRVSMTATDAVGNAETQELLVLFRPVPAHPITISSDGAYLDADKRIFPLGIYQVSPAAMPKVKQGGIQVVHSCEFESSQNDAKAKAYLDAAAAADLRVFIGFDRGRSSKKGLIQGNTEHVIQRVAALCDNPGLFCWYLFDEPEAAHQYVSPRGLIAYGNLIRRLDPYHAVVVVTYAAGMGAYRASYDTHWTEAYETPERDVQMLNSQRSRLPADTPITMISNCGSDTWRMQEGKPFDPAQFKPDGVWMRAAAFAGITQRVNGMWWWWYADDVKGLVTVAHVPEAWQALTKVFAQLHNLEPVFTDPAKPDTGSVDVGRGKVYWWRKKVGRETTLIAVNASEQQARATLLALGTGPATVLFENRQAQLQAGKLTDNFTRYAVHVYRYAD